MASDRPDRRRRSSSAPEKPHAVDLGGATLVHRLLDASPLDLTPLADFHEKSRDGSHS